MKQIFPNINYAYCVELIENNLAGALNDEYIKVCLWQTTRTYEANDYQDAMTDMVKHRPGITVWLLDTEPKH